MNQKLLSQFIVIFLVTNLLGLLVASTFIRENISVPIVNPDRESYENPLGLFLYILISTAVLLAVIKLLPKRTFLLFKILEGFAIFFMIPIVLWAVLSLFFKPQEFELALQPLALLVVILRNTLPEHLLLRNIITLFLAAGIGVFIGTGIGTIPIIAFLVAMSVYDYIAVFKTKHMMTLAKAVTEKNLSFTFGMPTPEHQFELGTGDLVIPLAFAVSVLNEYVVQLGSPHYWIAPLVILLFSFIGLVITLWQSSQKIGHALPALPLQSVLMILAYAGLRLFL
ncbi:MAG: hypothetical protein J4215_04665 [Candidatus Diapherotrites archaeon]|uniref:Signal-peptide peptidase, presenilin aspartyl protease n=1 Tax=Candidatus Iainarchaeum sp. TaxID=3101447 RepID=A0A8T4LEX4_9ARCH|nr:hypothetical protein [Candidatus Diapherotrites archaeon]